MNELARRIEQDRRIDDDRKRQRDREEELEYRIKHFWDFSQKQQQDYRMMELHNVALKALDDVMWMGWRALRAVHDIYELRCLRRQQAPTVEMSRVSVGTATQSVSKDPPGGETPEAQAGVCSPKIKPSGPSIGARIELPEDRRLHEFVAHNPKYAFLKETAKKGIAITV
jgi:hypothetical protein